MSERWKPFRHGYYEVSSYGRVRRAKRGEIRQITFVGKILKPITKNNGYKVIFTCVKSTYKQHYIHRLVAAAFIGPCPKGKEVNHVDCDKSNNHYRNLEYVTDQENQLHSMDWGLDRSALGSKKLDWDDIKKIRKKYKHGYSVDNLASKFDVSRMTIYRIVNNETWKEKK
jgi:hypothetical protein